MQLRTAAVLVLLVGFGIVAPRGAAPVMDVDEIRAGMTGIGRTVFEGTTREDFKVHILGVLRNVMGPRRNLILAKLEGGPLAHTGVIAGMSGSPVYVDGRLIGAVSYSLGSFAKEPIAGITPIAEMTEIVTLPPRRSAYRRDRLEGGSIEAEALLAEFRAAFSGLRPFATRPSDVEAVGLPAATASQIGAMLRPIATPLVMGGVSPDMMDLLSDVLRGGAFTPVVTGGSGGAAIESTEPLQPGDAVGVSLVRGDLELAGTGTVTHVDGDRVYAFGHPFFNLGPTSFPMTRAEVYTLLPSLFSSSKISAVGSIIGTFQQDRATAIAGTLDAGPPLIPLDVSLESDRGVSRRFRYELVSDQLFTPLLTMVSILNTLRSYEREAGAASFTVRGSARVKGHGDVAFENLFTGDAPSLGAATYVAAPITFLLSNDLEPVELERVDITITSTEQPRTASLERAWVDAVDVRPGITVPLKLLTRTYRGEEVVRTLPITIPANATGQLSILVSDAARLTQWEQREMRQPIEPQSVAQMIRTLNRTRRNNRLYVRLLSPEAGAVVNGEILTSLPPSVLAVFEADRSSGSFAPLRSATIGEWEIATDHAISGSRTLTINLEPR
jgi:hypothetical protein